jgi:N-acetylglucosamine-6-phosphate deacetylase
MSGGPLVIHASRVVTPGGVIEPGMVRIEAGTISAVEHSERRPSDEVTLSGAVLMPGFIDLHMHGYGGHGFQHGPEDAREAVQLVARTGVATCYAALGAGESIASIAANVTEIAKVVEADTSGARLAGNFLEGPFISTEKPGMWNPTHLRGPDVAELHALIEASKDSIRRVNVAPELPGALEFIRAARDADVAVSIGHSNATYEQALAAVEAGATITTHTFNAMSQLEQRAPGVVGATMTADGLLAELILDGVHVHPASALALWRARGPHGIALISDSTPMTGLPGGTYEFNGRTVIVQDGACRLPDGTLAGSVSQFDRDVRIAADLFGGTLLDLAAISSGNAARAMGIDGRTGAIAPGMDADLVLLDESLHVQATIVQGRVVYSR